jgi:general secretion pathway protein D
MMLKRGHNVRSQLRSSAFWPGAGLGHVLLLGALLGLVSGCASFRPPTFPEPLRGPKVAAVGEEVLQEAGELDRKRPLVEAHAARQPAPAPAAAAKSEPRLPDFPIRGPIAVVLDGVPIETFINVVYGMELGLGVQVDRALRDRPDLVSVRITPAQPAEKVYLIASEVLANYGVQVSELGGVVRFAPVASNSAGSAAAALLATRSLPDVPAGQRTVFVAMPLEASLPGTVAAQMRSLFANQQVSVSELVEANAILLSGPGDAVRSVMQAVTTLDRASLSNRASIRINPLYLPADLLARELREVISAQGISVRNGASGQGAVSFVPVNSANALIVFAESQAILDLIAEWAQRLDQPTDDGTGGGMFMYAARHTTVQTMVPVLEALIGLGTESGGRSAQGMASAAPQGSAAQGAAAQSGRNARNSAAAGGAGGASVTALAGANGSIAIDPVRNVIVFQGDAQRWRAIQGVLARLDQPARQVVIEVTIAEVTLTDEFSNGVEWALRNISINGSKGPMDLLKGAAGGSGLVWQGVSSSGQVRALVNLFAKDSRVSILSTPRLLVKSGESASIDVGTEVPTITSQATSSDLGMGGILQSVQYRKTGVLLDIEAVVHSGQRVDLKLSQEVSEAAKTETSDISSPSIFSRRLQTSLSLSDGESTLLGGLISRSRSTGKSKIPVLGDIPLVGAAFPSRTASSTRTELLMLITPYVVEDASQARAITDAIQATFAPRPAWNGGLLLGDGLERLPQPRLPLPAPAPVPAAADPLPSQD